VVRDGLAGVDAFIAPTLTQAMSMLPAATVVGIDMPIGIPETGARDCDTEARRLLGPRGSSVFPAPLRAVLTLRDYGEANLLQKALGRGLSRQTFGILPKIREVDTWIRRNTGLGPTLHEVHPELSFAIWNGDRPMAESKKSAGGRLQRCRLIDAGFPGLRADLLQRLRTMRDPRVFAEDDLCDAIAALWSARRIARGAHLTVPVKLRHDAFGLPMQIKG
jgi:predicted RNase H-like nuclease